MKKAGVYVRRILCLVIPIIIFTLLLHTDRVVEHNKTASHRSYSEEADYGNISLEFTQLTGEDIRSFKTYMGRSITFQYDYLINEGQLIFQIRDNNDKVLFDFLTGEEEYRSAISSFEKEEAVEIIEFGNATKVYNRGGIWKVVLIGENASGKIDISW